MERRLAARRIVKLTGDGLLAEFPSVVSAVSCATEIQTAMRARTSENTIQFRIGVNLGDVIAEGDDIYGDGVNVAARLESVAQPGGIAVSQSVRDHVGNRLSVTLEDRGEQQRKNIEKPIRVYDVLLDEPIRVEMPEARRDKPSITVLPFTNMSGDPEQEYFSDGVTEDIITDLSKISALSVIARNTSFTYKGKAVKTQSVGRELDADFILEGSVRKAGGRVRITGQLIEGRNGTHIWAERFDRDLTDIFAWVARALAIEPDNPPTLYNAAWTYAQLGDIDKAFELLHGGVVKGGPEWARWVQHDSSLGPIRQDPHYAELLEKCLALEPEEKRTMK